MGRVVVLTAEELATAEERFGRFFPISLSPLFFDRAGDRAFIHWSAGWYGGAFLGTRVDGKWRLQVLSSWIT